MKSSKKTFFPNRNTLIGGGLLFCIVLFSLTSCDNFLNGAETRQEIEDAIAYNNAPSSTLILKAPEGCGDFLSAGEKSCKVGYSIDVQFTVNSDSYVYRGLEAVSKSNAGGSHSDYVEFSELSTESEKSKGLYKVRIKLLKQSDDIMIRPKCLLLPKMLQASPAFTPSGYEQDEIIKFIFNKAMSAESFGNFDCVSIYSESGDLKQFFDPPYFSDNNTVLNIPPKQDTHILTPDSGQKLDISVSIDFIGVKDSDGLSIAQNASHSYRINDNFGNQQKAKFLVRTVEGTGSFISDGEKECTVGYGFELQFSVNQADYKFVGLEAVSKAGNESRDDFVSFTQRESNSTSETSGSYKIFVRALKPGDDILIRPKCILLPKVTSSEPAADNTSYQQDTSIKVHFNKKIKLSDFSDEYGFLKNIEITSGDTNLLDTSSGKFPYYKAPYLEDEDKTLVIPIVKGNYIIKDNSTKEISVSVKLEGLKDAVEGENAAFTQTSYDFNFKINSTKDSLPPQFKVLNLARTEADARNGTNLITMDEFTHYAAKANYGGDSTKVAENIQNHHVNKVWIYFEAEDTDSGVAGLEIREQLIRNKMGAVIQGSIYGYNNPGLKSRNYIVNTTDNASLSECIEYIFNSDDDGVVKLDFILHDKAENKTEDNLIKSLDLIKDTVCELDIQLYNTSGYVNENQLIYPFNFQLIPTLLSYDYMKDIDGEKYQDSFLFPNEEDESVAARIAGIFYGYNEENLHIVDSELISNVTKYSNYYKAYFYETHFVVNADPYKNLIIKIMIQDTVGNTKYVTKTLPAAMDVLFADLSKLQEDNSITIMIDNSNQSEFYLRPKYKNNLENSDGSLLEAKGPYATSLIRVENLFSYGDGYYYLYVCYSEDRPQGNNRNLSSYLGKSILIKKEGNAYSIVNAETQVTPVSQNDVPEFEVQVAQPVVNAGVRNIKITYKNFEPNPKLKYLIHYKAQSPGTAEGYSASVNFSVPSEYCSYDFWAVVMNEQNDKYESLVPITEELVEDNIPPVINATLYRGAPGQLLFSDVSQAYSTMTIKIQDQKLKNDNDIAKIKYVLSNTNSEIIDWKNDTRIMETPIKELADTASTSIWGFDIITYEQDFPNYCYVLVQDLAGNYSQDQYLCRAEKTYSPKINYSNGAFSISVSYINKQFINSNNYWQSCEDSTNTITLSAAEKKSFVLIHSWNKLDTGSTGYKYMYADPIYFYPDYYISNLECDLKNISAGLFGYDISADQPCFAHTMYYPYNLGNAAEVWINRGQETGVVMKKKSFTYFYDNTNGVPSGYYYTTVVHFADGTVLMTDVKQK